MPKTYNELYIELWQRLRDTGVEAHLLEARLLVAAAAGKTQEELLRDLQLYSSDEIEERVREYARRRFNGEPAAYITGAWGFYGLEVKLTRDVLIPRADTETLVEQALALLNGRPEDARILDLCTGSGCVGCALAKTLPRSRAVLIDSDETVLAVAEENIRNLGLTDRVECRMADAKEAPPPGIGSFDLIVCNPPYVPSAQIEALDASVRDYEPHRALDGGADGLDFYRAILEHWPAVLRQTGHFLLEVGEDQAAEVQRIMRRAGLHGLGAAKDAAGIERVVYGKF